jgi:nucleotide-binding universal stress UspA family protein
MSASDTKTGDAVPTFHRILFPTDFSESCYVALPFAQRMASLDGAEILLLHVVEDVPVVSEMGMYFQGGAFQMEAFMDAAKERLKIEKTRFQGEWQPVELDVRVGDPAGTIDDYAREKGVDLIVMATHQPGFVERLFVGSVAEGTLRDAPCPVLVVPVPAGETHAESPVESAQEEIVKA